MNLYQKTEALKHKKLSCRTCSSAAVDHWVQLLPQHWQGHPCPMSQSTTSAATDQGTGIGWGLQALTVSLAVGLVVPRGAPMPLPFSLAFPGRMAAPESAGGAAQSQAQDHFPAVEGICACSTLNSPVLSTFSFGFLCTWKWISGSTSEFSELSQPETFLLT